MMTLHEKQQKINLDHPNVRYPGPLPLNLKEIEWFHILLGGNAHKWG